MLRSARGQDRHRRGLGPTPGGSRWWGDARKGGRSSPGEGRGDPEWRSTQTSRRWELSTHGGHRLPAPPGRGGAAVLVDCFIPWTHLNQHLFCGKPRWPTRVGATPSWQGRGDRRVETLGRKVARSRKYHLLGGWNVRVALGDTEIRADPTSRTGTRWRGGVPGCGASVC